MISALSCCSTNVNEKRRSLLVRYSNEEQKLIQIVYFLYIDNPNLHIDVDCMFKIGTCTLNRFEERLTEHSRKFSSKISVVDFLIIPNASMEKDFHKFMDSKYPQYIISLETADGKFKEIYKCHTEVVSLFYTKFRND